MTRTQLLAAASAFSILGVAACNFTTSPADNSAANGAAPAETAPAETDGLAKLATVQMSPDTSYLTAEEREVVDLLNQAANLMGEIYKRQTSPNYGQLRAQVAARGDAKLLEKFDAFYGPWDPVEDNEPFFGNQP